MFDVAQIIQGGGLLLIALIIFAESGMFIGFFFPGDTLLLSAGVFAAQGKLDLASVIVVVSLAAIIGDNIGYLIGRRFGPTLFNKKDSIVFNKKHLDQSHAFFAKYGPEAMLIAHFIPVIRTFAPAAAGMSNMNHKRFIIYDAIGDIAWATLVTLIGYWFGTKIPDIDHYILFVVGLVVIATLLPTIYHFTRAVIQKRSGKKP
jgi:membrane-associated protein